MAVAAADTAAVVADTVAAVVATVVDVAMAAETSGAADKPPRGYLALDSGRARSLIRAICPSNEIIP